MSLVRLTSTLFSFLSLYDSFFMPIFLFLSLLLHSISVWVWVLQVSVVRHTSCSGAARLQCLYVYRVCACTAVIVRTVRTFTAVSNCSLSVFIYSCTQPGLCWGANSRPSKLEKGFLAID